MRILIAEDDEALAKFVRQGLEGEQYTVDAFKDGEQSLSAALACDYEAVILDLNLPKLDGVGVLRQLRMKKPSLPILILAQRTRVEDRVQCLDTGADDYVPKQMSQTSLAIAHIRNELISKIRTAAQSRRSRFSPVKDRKPPQSARFEMGKSASAAPAIVAIGVSTGGPKALEQILPMSPPNLPVPILIVQHMPVGFTATFPQRLNSICPINVKEAAQGELMRPGAAYIAPAGVHMRVVSGLSDSKPANGLDQHPVDAMHVPSVDVLMNSVAQVFKNRALGVIMTGMGSDGAAGMTAIFRKGGLTIGQDEASCAVYGMPRVCAQLGVLTHVLPLSDNSGTYHSCYRCRRRA
jgi:two-component system, chemotaxis family, protein-glutamate methylesterase/glutaminase